MSLYSAFHRSRPPLMNYKQNIQFTYDHTSTLIINTQNAHTVYPFAELSMQYLKIINFRYVIFMISPGRFDDATFSCILVQIIYKQLILYANSSGQLWLHLEILTSYLDANHDDVIKWKHFPRYWPFVRGIHRFQVNYPHKGQWRGALMFSLISAWINDWVNNRAAGDLRRYRGHYDVIVMSLKIEHQ